MSEKPDVAGTLISSLEQQRDELKLKMHLTGMETKDEYEQLSGKLDELLVQYEPVSDTVEETAGNVISALMPATDST